MTKVTISPKFQVVLPKAVRMDLGLKPGMQCQVFNIGGRIQIVPLRSIKELRGICKGMDPHFERESDRAL